MAVEWWVESFYCAILVILRHSTAIVWPFCCHSTCIVWHIPNLCETPSRAWFTVLYSGTNKFGSIELPYGPWSLVHTQCAPHAHSAQQCTQCTTSFEIRAKRVYVSRALSRGRNVNIFCFKCQFKRLTRLLPRPSPSSAPAAVLLSRPPTVRSPCCFRLPSAQSALVLRFCCCGFASSDKVRPLVLWPLQIMDTEPINTTSGAPQEVRLLVWGRNISTQQDCSKPGLQDSSIYTVTCCNNLFSFK